MHAMMGHKGQRKADERHSDSETLQGKALPPQAVAGIRKLTEIQEERFRATNPKPYSKEDIKNMIREVQKRGAEE